MWKWNLILLTKQGTIPILFLCFFSFDIYEAGGSITIHTCIHVHCMYIRVFDKLIGTPLAQRASYVAHHNSLFGPDGAGNYDYIVTNSINSLLIGSRCISNGAYTNHCWANLAQASKLTLSFKKMFFITCIIYNIIFIIKNILKNERVSFEAWAKLLQLFELKIDWQVFFNGYDHCLFGIHRGRPHWYLGSCIWDGC